MINVTVSDNKPVLVKVDAFTADSLLGVYVKTVTGDGVDNTNPYNPIISFPTPAEIGAEPTLGFLPIESVTGAYVDNTDPQNPIINTPPITHFYPLDFIDFKTNANPTHQEGRLHWDADVQTLEVDTEINGVHVELGHQAVGRVMNKTLFTITKGKAIYINGSQGQRPTIATADNGSEATSKGTLALTMHDIQPNEIGYIISMGPLRDINTSGFSVGDQLYLGVGGNITNIEPIAPAHSVLIGKVIVSHPTQGIVYVDIQNGHEVSELHDVLITDIQDGEILKWNAALGLFINAPDSGSSGGVAGTLDEVLTAGNISNKSIILKNPDNTKQVEIKVLPTGQILFNAGASQNFHFSGDVVAFSDGTGGGSGGGSGSSGGHIIARNLVPYAQQPTLNFSTQFVVTNDLLNLATTIELGTLPVPSLQQVTAVGNDTTFPIILKNATDPTKTVTISVSDTGQVIFTAGTSKNFHFSGDVIAFSDGTGGGSGGGGGGTSGHIIARNLTPFAAQPTLNFSTQFTVTNDTLNLATTIGLTPLVIADVSGLQAALDAKSAIGHTHTISEISNINTLTLQAVTDYGNSTNKAIILKNTAGTKEVSISVNSDGNIIFNTGVNQNFHFAGDVIAFSSLTPPVASWWDSLPVASTTVLGGVKIDGTTITITGGVISAVAGAPISHSHVISDVTGLQAALDSKEPVITAGTTAQYWRGDKTWQTLNSAAVAELTNLYFTEARVRASVLTGYSVGSNTVLAATDSILTAFGKVQGQLNAKAATLSGTVNYLSKFTSATTIGNSQVIDDGSTVGVGSISTTKFHVQGSGSFADDNSTQDTANYASFGITRSNSGTNSSYLGFTKQGQVAWGMGINSVNNFVIGFPNSSKHITSEFLGISSAGNVGIGMNPTYKFDVSGIIRSSNDLLITSVAAGDKGLKMDDGSTRILSLTRESANEARFYSYSYHTFYSGAGTGVERARIDSSGKLGVNSNAPIANLTVFGSLSTSSLENVFTIGRGFNSGIAYSSVAGFYLSNPNVGVNNTRLDIRLLNGNSGGITDPPDTTVLTLLSNANVGINVANPSARLQVQSDTAPNNTDLSSQITLAKFLYFESGGNQVGLTFKSLKNITSSDWSHTGTRIANTVASDGYAIDSVYNNLCWIDLFNEGYNGALKFGTNNTERVRIDASGNMGIGVVSPRDKLQIGGPLDSLQRGGNLVMNYLALGETGGGASTILGNNIKASGAVGSNVIRFTNGTDSGNFIKINYSRGVTFHTGITSTLGADIDENTNERVRIDTSGNVAIGAITPSQKLHVDGNILAVGEVTAFSDRRLKTDIIDYLGGLDKILEMTPVSYRSLSDEKIHLGLIAQDVKEIENLLVQSEGEYLSLNYQKITVLLINAVKELNTKLNKLYNYD